MNFIFPLVSAFLITIFSTFFYRKLAYKYNITDKPSARKIHKMVIPYGGGLAIFTGFFATIFIFDIDLANMSAIFFGASAIMCLGLIDDIYSIDWKIKLTLQGIIMAISVAMGLEISYITNPLGGTFDLTSISYLSEGITVIWLLIFINAINLIDGLDGLATGISGIASITIGILALMPFVMQINTSIASFVLAMSCIAFLYWNWNPAKIFLGDAGSYLLGFLIGALAIHAGGKIATVFLVLSIPVMDVVFVVAKRLIAKKSIFSADQRHLHHELINIGWSQKKIVSILFLISLSIGITSLFLGTISKIVMLAGLFLIMLFITIKFFIKNNK